MSKLMCHLYWIYTTGPDAKFRFVAFLDCLLSLTFKRGPHLISAFHRLTLSLRLQQSACNLARKLAQQRKHTTFCNGHRREQNHNKAIEFRDIFRAH